jgi:tetratricopeptide (TPR) repeat protein
MSSGEEAKAAGLRYFQQKQHKAALEQFAIAEKAFAATGNGHGRAEMLNNIGVIYRMQRRYVDAQGVLETAVALFAAAGDSVRQGMTLGNIGDLLAAQKKREEAARAYSDAAELFARANAPVGQSRVLRALSLLRLRQGQFLAAMVHMEQSLRVKPRRGPLGWLFLQMLRLALGILG